MISIAIEKRNRRQVMQGGAAVLATLAFGGRAQAQTKYQWGVGSVDPFFSCCYVTLKKGYFKDQGIDIEYMNSQSGPRTKQMLAAGQLLVGTSGANDPMTITLAGKPATLIFGLDRKITYANMLVHKDNYDSGKYRSLKDLGGTRIAVTQPQSATWLMAVFMIEHAGVKQPVDIRGLGDLATMLGALKSKQVAASVATMGMMEQAVHEGWGVPIFDVTDDKAWSEIFGGDVPGLGAYVMEDSISKRPKELQAFVTAMCKGQDFLNSNSPEAIVDLIREDYLSSFPAESLRKTIAVYKDKIWKKDNLIGKEEYQRLTGIMGGGRQFSDEEMKKVPYEQAVNMSFVKKARNL
jgi:NitT/TauT family transport system substrate-binding protein